MGAEDVIQFLETNKDKFFTVREISENIDISSSSVVVIIKRLYVQGILKKKLRSYKSIRIYAYQINKNYVKTRNKRK
jgi:predicted transcriptional regulator